MKCAWNELLGVLPPWLREQVDRHQSLQEIRLRLGEAPVLVNSTAREIVAGCVSEADLQYVINMACRYSPWTIPSMAQGYVTIPGGHRIGLCGQALTRYGRMSGIGTLTSLNIRVCRDFTGISRNLWLHPGSILLIGPPGSGKTTLLRDLIRRRAGRENVAVVDERGEIFPVAAGFTKGENTDVLTGCGKQQGIETVLRVMTPQCIAVDEITAMEDCQALIQAGKCGVNLLATAHASTVSDLRGRPIYGKLLDSGLFDCIVVLQMDKSWRTERMER